MSEEENLSAIRDDSSVEIKESSSVDEDIEDAENLEDELGAEETGEEKVDVVKEEKSNEISSLAENVKSHFIVVIKRNKRGLARYRCITCGHEFECCGKIRLVHHVIGFFPDGTRVRHVKPCLKPFQPLREALITQVLAERNGPPKRVKKKAKETALARAIHAFLEQQQSSNANAEQLNSDFLLLVNSLPKIAEISATSPPVQPSITTTEISESTFPTTAHATALSPQEEELSHLSRERMLSLLLILRQISPQNMQLALEFDRVREYPVQSLYNLDFFPLFSSPQPSSSTASSISSQQPSFLCNNNSTISSSERPLLETILSAPTNEVISSLNLLNLLLSQQQR